MQTVACDRESEGMNILLALCSDICLSFIFRSSLREGQKRASIFTYHALNVDPDTYVCRQQLCIITDNGEKVCLLVSGKA